MFCADYLLGIASTRGLISHCGHKCAQDSRLQGYASSQIAQLPNGISADSQNSSKETGQSTSLWPRKTRSGDKSSGAPDRQRRHLRGEEHAVAWIVRYGHNTGIISRNYSVNNVLCM